MQIKEIIPAIDSFCEWWGKYGGIISALFSELDVQAIQEIIGKLKK